MEKRRPYDNGDGRACPIAKGAAARGLRATPGASLPRISSGDEPQARPGHARERGESPWRSQSGPAPPHQVRVAESRLTAPRTIVDAASMQCTHARPHTTSSEPAPQVVDVFLDARMVAPALVLRKCVHHLLT